MFGFRKGFILSIALGMCAASTNLRAQLGVFILTGPMVTNPGTGHSATLLANGNVLIAGGFGQYSEFLVTSRLGQDTWRGAELYDPATGTFMRAGRMLVPRIGHAAV